MSTNQPSEPQALPVPTPQGNGGPASQPAAQGEGMAVQAPGKVNLYELEDFRKYQSAMDARLAKEQQERAALQAQVRELTMKDMGEVERLQYAIRERDARLQELEQERLQAEQSRLAREMRQKDLTRISKASGVPMDYLDKAESFDHAWELVEQYQNANGQKAEERSSANAPYLPAGRPSTPDVRQAQELKDAIAAKDGVAYLRHILGG